MVARPPRGQGVPVHRWGAGDGGDVPGHQRGSWAAGEWCPQQQKCPQPSVSSAVTDPCRDAIKAGRKPAAALAAGGKGKGGTGHKPGWGCGREEEEGEHCREDAQTQYGLAGRKEGTSKDVGVNSLLQRKRVRSVSAAQGLYTSLAAHLLRSWATSLPANPLLSDAGGWGSPPTGFTRSDLRRAPVWAGGLGPAGGTGCRDHCAPMEGRASLAGQHGFPSRGARGFVTRLPKLSSGDRAGPH